MTSGRNDWPAEQLEFGHDDAKQLWEAIFASNASGDI